MPEIITQKPKQDYFELFLRQSGLRFTSIEYGTSPDVIARADIAIGVEITNYYLEQGPNPESEYAQRIARQSAIERARRFYLKNNGRRVEFSFEFDRTRPIQDSNSVVNGLVALAQRTETLEPGFISESELDYRDLVPGLQYVSVGAQECDNPQWRDYSPYPTPPVSLKMLADIVSDKEGRAALYRPCDVYWLLFIVDLSDANLDDELKRGRINLIWSKVFQRIIIYNVRTGDIIANATLVSRATSLR